MKFHLTSSSKTGGLLRYGLAILIAVAALFLRQLMGPVLGDANPFHTAWPAVIFAAWFCGMFPAIVTAVIDVIGIWYFILPPVHSFKFVNPQAEISGMLGFLFFSGCIIALSETNRRSLARSQLAEERLQRAHDELDQRVQERTAALTKASETLNLANENFRALSAQLLRLQDDERRRIARELHDSIGQLLAALGMNVARVHQESHRLSSEAARAVSENLVMVNEISREIRTLSHLLHPPMLDEIGLPSALRWYVDGFSERSKVEVKLELPEGLGRLSKEMELTIFRLIQECLTNIHRHSGSKSAAVRLRQEDHHVTIEVQDQGTGIPADKLADFTASNRAGVGFRGMRERLRQLDGTLEIRSDATGTTVIASLPRALDADAVISSSIN